MAGKTASLSTARRVREAIAMFKDDELFTTQQLLYCGSRAAIDSELSQMVLHEGLKRVTRGVFIKRELHKISPREIAMVKAAAFGKMIYQHGLEAAFETGIIDEKPNSDGVFTFYTSGCSSSFKFGIYTIRFVSTSARKRKLPDDEIGKILKAVWQLGRRNVDRTMVKARHAKFKLKGEKAKSFRIYILKTPLWLVKSFYPTLA